MLAGAHAAKIAESLLAWDRGKLHPLVGKHRCDSELPLLQEGLQARALPLVGAPSGPSFSL
jgi:hypothetical protein